ncbi:MAG: hypothetical protein ACI8QS_003267 [Planctomycetota bacterium]|jgi:hypothetical protein
MTSSTTNAGLSRTWLVLFTSLCLSAGHGLVLTFIVSRLHLIPSMAEMGGGEMAILVMWFLLSVPLAILALLLRGRLERMARKRLNLITMVVLTLTVVAFLRYINLVSNS